MLTHLVFGWVPVLVQHVLGQRAQLQLELAQSPDLADLAQALAQLEHPHPPKDDCKHEENIMFGSPAISHTQKGNEPLVSLDSSSA